MLTLQNIEELRRIAKEQPFGLEEDYDASANGNYDDTFQDGYKAGQVDLARSLPDLLSAASWALERGYADSEGMECQMCHKRSPDVSHRENAYAQEIGHDPDAMHTVCDSCDHENRMDI